MKENGWPECTLFRGAVKMRVFAQLRLFKNAWRKPRANRRKLLLVFPTSSKHNCADCVRTRRNVAAHVQWREVKACLSNRNLRTIGRRSGRNLNFFGSSYLRVSPPWLSWSSFPCCSDISNAFATPASAVRRRTLHLPLLGHSSYITRAIHGGRACGLLCIEQHKG
jgi:hypothetical protein